MVRGSLAALSERWTWNPDSCWELLVRTWLLPIINHICDRNWTVAWLHTCILMHSPGGTHQSFLGEAPLRGPTPYPFTVILLLILPLSNKTPPPNKPSSFQGKKVNKPPSSLFSSRSLPSLNCSSLIITFILRGWHLLLWSILPSGPQNDNKW